jgi:sortase (surface protein transpeptidase)
VTAVAAGPRTSWRARRAAVALPPLSPRLQLARAALVAVFVISVSLLLELVVVSNLQHRSAQQRAFDRFRSELATGTAPIGPVDANGRRLAAGAPVAYLEIPTIGLRQVVVEGTSSGDLFSGPGHRRDSPLPGQAGVSVLLGRRAAFGGPFRRIADLQEGDLIHVTTGLGEFDYRVSGLRLAGDPVPAPAAAGKGRLLLATSAGRPYMPDGVLRVDAELESAPAGGAGPLLTGGSLPASEHMMAADTSTLWALVLWLQALTILAVVAVWAWHRWGRARTWVVFFPPLLLVGLSASGEAARLMPNLL